MKKWFRIHEHQGFDDVEIDSHDANRRYFAHQEDDSYLLVDLPELMIGLLDTTDDKNHFWIEARKEVT